METGSSYSAGESSFSSAPPSSSRASDVKLDKDGLPKKKRKQLVACDGCRLRRVKCNKLDTGAGACSECEKKNIKCTDSYVRTKPKAVRSGKLIQKAKILYGDGGAGSSNSNYDSPEPSPTETAFGTGGQSTQVVRAAEARFVSGELARAISGHLIRAYKDLVHTQCPLVDWSAFTRDLDLAGGSTEKMSPTGECLSLVVQAWAARFSDSSLIVGTGAPSLTDVYEHRGRDFSESGNARENFARAMADRALRMIDEKGLLRRPSAAAASALIMLEFLMTWGDEHRRSGRHLMAAAVEHLRAVNDGLSDDPTEEISAQDRTSGGTLFWMAYTRDALSSAFAGRATCLTDDDLVVLCELLANSSTADDIMTYITSNDPRILTGLGVVSLFRNITTVVRDFTARVAGPLPRRQRLNIGAIRDMWAEMDVAARYATVFQDSIQKAHWTQEPNSNVWFRDLVAMRAQLSHAIHRSILRRLETERHPSGQLDGEHHLYIENLERLKLESDERFLGTSREVVKLARSYGTNLIGAASLTCENLPSYLSHMLAMPCWEQGGPQNWPLASKQEEIPWAITALKLLGWSWANFQRPILDAELALDQLAAQVEQARACAPPSHSPLDHDQYQHFEGDQHAYPSPSSYQYPSANEPTQQQPQQQPPPFAHPQHLPAADEPWRRNFPPQIPLRYPSNYDGTPHYYTPAADHPPPPPPTTSYYPAPPAPGPGPPQYPPHSY